jgi:tetratricopeptide (TPR) repeat protein
MARPVGQAPLRYALPLMDTSPQLHPSVARTRAGMTALACARGIARRAPMLMVVMVVAAGCTFDKPPPATTTTAAPAKPAAPTLSPEEQYKQQRIERAKAHLSDGLGRYDTGNYPEALASLMMAVDSAVLPTPELINARKHIAFIHAVNSREPNSRDEFEKVFLLDPKFELSTAESGHPAWGPIYRAVKAEFEARRTGKAPVVAAKVPTQGEKLLADAVTLYDRGDYAKALKGLQDAQKESLSITDRVKAMKLTAFSYCLTNRNALCRTTFENILQLKPDFVLDAAEVGHPSWGPSYRAVKSKQTVPKKPQ